MKIDRFHNGYKLTIDREEAIDLIARLSDCLRRQKVRADNQKLSPGAKFEKTQLVAYFHQREPERQINIALEDLE